MSMRGPEPSAKLKRITGAKRTVATFRAAADRPQKNPPGTSGRVVLRADRDLVLVRGRAKMGHRVWIPARVVVGIPRLVMFLFPSAVTTGVGVDFR